MASHLLGFEDTCPVRKAVRDCSAHLARRAEFAPPAVVLVISRKPVETLVEIIAHLEPAVSASTPFPRSGNERQMPYQQGILI